MRALRRVIVLVLALALPAPALAADYQAGLEAFQRDDYATALKELWPLAEQGDAEAQFNLGAMYLLGHGVPQDYVQAHMWYSLAVANPLPGERHDLAIKSRDNVEAKMTPDQIAEAQRLASEWKPK